MDGASWSEKVCWGLGWRRRIEEVDGRGGEKDEVGEVGGWRLEVRKVCWGFGRVSEWGLF